MKQLILASASPRRKQLLEEAGFSFTIKVSDAESSPQKGLSPEKFAVSCAIEKAEDIFKGVADDGVVVLGADTVVCLDGVILGKPNGKEQAEQMLKNLSGKTHQVITGYAILSKGMRETGKVITKVKFFDLDEKTLDDYLKSGLWQGKAGAYGIQDGFKLVESYDGDYDNVVGLPVKALKSTIEEFLK